MNKLFYVPVNLQEAIIHTNEPNNTGSIVAILWLSRKAICIRKGMQSYQDDIVKLVKQNQPEIDFKVLYGDSFRIDTWDNVMSDFYIHNEQLKYDFEYYHGFKDHEIAYHGKVNDRTKVWEIELYLEEKDRYLKYFYPTEEEMQHDEYFLRIHLKKN